MENNERHPSTHFPPMEAKQQSSATADIDTETRLDGPGHIPKKLTTTANEDQH
jgi:hypothetical protein